jgi:hypothetical protein
MTNKTETAGPVSLYVVLPRHLVPPRAGQDPVGQPKIAHAAARLHLQYIPPSYAAMHLSLARLDKHQPVTTGSRDSEK